MFMIFQQHPKQEIARIVPLIGDCCAGRWCEPFSWKNVFYERRAKMRSGRKGAQIRRRLQSLHVRGKSYQVADHIDRIALFNSPWKDQIE
jgi:hypothetical protein